MSTNPVDLNEYFGNIDKDLQAYTKQIKNLNNEIKLRDLVIEEIIAQFDRSRDPKWRKEFKESIFKLVIKENEK